MSDEKLKGIIGRQIAADQKAREEAEAKDRAALESERKAAAGKAAWDIANANLRKTIDVLNEKLNGSGLKIYDWGADSNVAPALCRIHFGLYERNADAPLRTGRLSVSVSKFASVHVSATGLNQVSSKSTQFDAGDANEEKWEEVLLDYLDSNVPK